MLSIGEFSNICKVSTKTLRYYAEIGLLLPSEINAVTGYRYYAVEQLERMLFISRLKSYDFSLEEIKEILNAKESKEEVLYTALVKKKEAMDLQQSIFAKRLQQVEDDLHTLSKGESLMAYLDAIDVRLVDVPPMYVISIRKMVQQCQYPNEYRDCFQQLCKRIEEHNLSIISPPMVLFHDKEFTPFGLDTEFAIPIKEYITGSKDFKAGLCLKSVVRGSYSMLTSIYAKQMKYAEDEGYENTGALFEVYVVDPSLANREEDLITEVYYPVKKMMEPY